MNIPIVFAITAIYAEPMEQTKSKANWETIIPLGAVEGVYAFDGYLWIHDGQWKGELLDLKSGRRVRSVVLNPAFEILRQILSPEAMKWRIQVQPIVVQDSLLISVTNSAGPRFELGEFGLLLVHDWMTDHATCEPVKFRSLGAGPAFARGIHQGAFITGGGDIGLLTAHSLQEDQPDGGPFSFAFFVVDEASRAFEMLSQVTHEGDNIGMAYRDLSWPAGWKLRENEQPTCFDWSPNLSEWTYRGEKFEAQRRDNGFSVRSINLFGD